VSAIAFCGPVYTLTNSRGESRLTNYGQWYAGAPAPVLPGGRRNENVTYSELNNPIIGSQLGVGVKKILVAFCPVL
jgi:hypothetical protein